MSSEHELHRPRAAVRDERAILAKHIARGPGPVRPPAQSISTEAIDGRKRRLRIGVESGPDQAGDFFKIAGRQITHEIRRTRA